ncbi:MAG: hypothetical protein EA001_00415, partial [Oscillatoriales cyanobacterium]
DFEGDQKILACAETFHHWVAIEAFEQAASFIYSVIPGLGQARLSSYLVWNGRSDYIQNCLAQVKNHLSLEASILCIVSSGAAYYYQDDYKQVVKLLSEACEKHSSLTKPDPDYRGDCWSWMALAYNQLGNLSAARDCFQKSIAYFDRDLEVKFRSNSALMRVSLIEQDYTHAGEIFQSFQAGDKNDLDLPQDTNELTASDGASIHNLYLDLASYHVVCQLSKLLEGTQADSLLDQGNAIASLIQDQKKKYQKNLDKISSAILSSVALHLCCHLGDFEQASLELAEIQSVAKTIIKSTLNFLALKSRGVLAYYRSDFAEALVVFSKCVEVATAGQIKVYAPLAHYYLAKTHQALFNQTQSNYHFQEAIDWLTKMGATRRIEQVQQAMQNPVQGLDMIW